MSRTVADPYVALQDRREGITNIPDFLIGTGMAWPFLVPGLGLPANVVVAAFMVVVATFRVPKSENRLPLWYPVLAFLMVLWVTISGLYNDVLPMRSMAYWVLFALVLLVVTTGRIDRVSLCRGLGMGLMIGAATGYAGHYFGIGESAGYLGRMTGYIWGDPNQAGYYLTVLGALAMVGVRPGWPRRIGMGIVGIAVLLTLSRTSTLAMIVAAAWFLLRRYQRPWVAIGVTGVLAYTAIGIAEQLRNWGPFQERVGSDQLRQRIDDESQRVVDLAPWIGHGPGTSQVFVGGQRFFFHDSYLSIRNIGGWILLTLILLLVALVFFRLLRLPQGLHHPWHEAAIIASLICAASLGEVLLRMPVALAIGLGMRHVRAPHELTAVDRDASPDRVL